MTTVLGSAGTPRPCPPAGVRGSPDDRLGQVLQDLRERLVGGGWAGRRDRATAPGDVVRPCGRLLVQARVTPTAVGPPSLPPAMMKQGVGFAASVRSPAPNSPAARMKFSSSSCYRGRPEDLDQRHAGWRTFASAADRTGAGAGTPGRLEGRPDERRRSVLTSFSIRRVETPSRKQVATTVVRARSARLRRSSGRREVRP